MILERLLVEIPELFKDYSERISRKYIEQGKFEFTDVEFRIVRNRLREGKLLCVIEQDTTIAGKGSKLINYIVDLSGYTPLKKKVQEN